MQRWKAAALASVLCSSVLSIWMCREGLLLGHRLGPALAPLRRPPRTLDARIARLAQCKPSPAPCLESDTPNIAATIMVERCIQWSGATEAYFRWGGGRVQIPSTAWQGCQRGWLLGTGVPRLSCHKELGSSPEGPRGQMEIRPGHSAWAAPAAQWGVEEEGGWTRGPSDLPGAGTGEAEEDLEIGRVLEMGRKTDIEEQRMGENDVGKGQEVEKWKCQPWGVWLHGPAPHSPLMPAGQVLWGRSHAWALI